ncbi:MAG: hypothetical protein OEM78_03495 [Gammaproteobacteria bacterium]|nr:hypothetical protein [Gammaproteobacteria bacterium]
MQATHVVARVLDRRAGERSAAPVSSRVALVELDAEHIGDDVLQAYLRGIANQSRRDLRVDERGRQSLCVLKDDLEILPTAVHDPRALVAQQAVVQGAEIDVGETIDAGDRIASRDLNQTQLRVIGLLADELGVEWYRVDVGELIEKTIQQRVVVDVQL